MARHSAARQAWVRMNFETDALRVDVEDHGKGFIPNQAKHGIGLVAMRERAQLLGGSIEFLRPASGGALVRLTVPRERPEANAG